MLVKAIGSVGGLNQFGKILFSREVSAVNVDIVICLTSPNPLSSHS